MKRKVKAKLKGVRKRSRQLGPQTDQEKLFCTRWLIHFDKDRAHREAGYAQHANRGHQAISLLERFADYLRPIQEAKAKLIAERLVVDSEAVLKEMTSRVFFDPTEFYEITDEPLTELVKVAGKREKEERVRTWNGQPVYGERMKPYADLTAGQRRVVEVTGETGGRIQYRLPTIREQHQFLTSIGRQYGMFAEKLIMERHNHQHTYHHLSFQNVSTEKLQLLTRQMLPLVGLEFAQSLGFTAAEVEEASVEEGVLMPARAAG